MTPIRAWSEDNLSITAARDLRNQPTDGIDVIDRLYVQSNGLSTTSGAVRLTCFTPTRTMTVSNIRSSAGGVAGVYTSGTGVVCRMGLYTVDATTNAATLVARTANDTTLWIATNTSYNKAFDTTGGYPSTYTLVAGQRYAAAAIVYNSGGSITTPTFVGASIQLQVGGDLLPRISASISGQTDLATSATTSASSLALWFRLT